MYPAVTRCWAVRKPVIGMALFIHLCLAFPSSLQHYIILSTLCCFFHISIVQDLINSSFFIYDVSTCESYQQFSVGWCQMLKWPLSMFCLSMSRLVVPSGNCTRCHVIWPWWIYSLFVFDKYNFLLLNYDKINEKVLFCNNYECFIAKH